MSTQDLVQQAQYLHNIFVTGITLSICVGLAVLVEYIRWRNRNGK